ncbi:unnamed protein product [Adineta ricciae]|uniref:Uncharacterized protein n=1 Tax=Adineta ricciae TaxID=249248 RepID=A0A815D350_ADIRI|nr:unnamed protein product [Adineta ricciae]CAF1568925.1 unnamed protein product [Adineta ricciae]
MTDYSNVDIHSCGTTYFSFLSTSRQLSETTIAKNTEQFLSRTFINTHAIPRSGFYFQVDSIISQFPKLITQRFSQTLSLLRDVLNSNVLGSSYFLNLDWQIYVNRTCITIPVRLEAEVISLNQEE